MTNNSMTDKRRRTLMKRPLRLLIALVLGAFLLALTSSDSMAQQGRRRFSADTGVVTLGPNQKLRVAVAGDFDGNGDVGSMDFVFQRMEYIEQDNIYRVGSQVT